MCRRMDRCGICWAGVQEEKLLRKPAAGGKAGVHAERGRQTICISTQAGCAVDCQFCLTGAIGVDTEFDGGRDGGPGFDALKEMEERDTGVSDR